MALRSQLREAEVQNLSLPAMRHEDVGGLDVAMDDLIRVGDVEGVRPYRDTL